MSNQHGVAMIIATAALMVLPAYTAQVAAPILNPPAPEPTRSGPS
ncbi:hypothetical protein [Corynebacterium occultum]|nr:hypothetical protein [Corynebacterium occultum]